MNCEIAQALITGIVRRTASDAERTSCMIHIEQCPDCEAALRGAEVLHQLAARQAAAPRAELFDQVVQRATKRRAVSPGRHRFLLGSIFGAALAASIFAAALFVDWGDNSRVGDRDPVEFALAVGEPRQVDLAFETDSDLDGATITIELIGDVEISGFGARRELTWPENLVAGVNRLSLPVVASSASGGRMIVRLSHPRTEQMLVVDLPAES
jgi:ferric-dicitrate binding protein FerR (iron transport regulator)